MILRTWDLVTRVRVIGWSRAEVLNIVNFTRALGKGAPNLAIQSYMLNRTTNFTRGRGIRIHRGESNRPRWGE